MLIHLPWLTLVQSEAVWCWDSAVCLSSSPRCLAHVLLTGLRDHACERAPFVCETMHPLNIVIRLPLFYSHISYKMTHRRKLLTRQTVQPHAPSLLLIVCVCCVCQVVLPGCKCVCVSELTGSFFFLWLRTGRGKSSFFFWSQDIWEWCTGWNFHAVVAYCSRSFLEWEGVWTWTLGKARRRCVTWATNCMPGSVEFDSIASDHKSRLSSFSGRSDHDSGVCLCLCEPDLVTWLTGSSQHIIVLKQMIGVNGTQQTRGSLVSGRRQAAAGSEFDGHT